MLTTPRTTSNGANWGVGAAGQQLHVESRTGIAPIFQQEAGSAYMSHGRGRFAGVVSSQVVQRAYDRQGFYPRRI